MVLCMLPVIFLGLLCFKIAATLHPMFDDCELIISVCMELLAFSTYYTINYHIIIKNLTMCMCAKYIFAI